MMSKCESVNVSRKTQGSAETISKEQWERSCVFFVADALVSERAAVLMCIVLPANCVTPICPLSFAEWCEVCGCTQSSWSETILRTSKFTIWAIWWAVWSVRTAPYFFRQWQFLYPFLVKDLHTLAHTETISLTRISAAVVRSVFVWFDEAGPSIYKLTHPCTLHMFPFVFQLSFRTSCLLWMMISYISYCNLSLIHN